MVEYFHPFLLSNPVLSSFFFSNVYRFIKNYPSVAKIARLDDNNSTSADNENVDKDIDLIPMTFLTAGVIQRQPLGRNYVCLLDSGSTTSWIRHDVLPKGTVGDKADKMTGSTLAGTFTSSSTVTLENVRLPEFFIKRQLVNSHVSESSLWRFSSSQRNDV